MFLPSLEAYVETRRIRGTSFHRRLTRLSYEEQCAVSEVIDILRPSANTLRDIMRYFDEICVRDERQLCGMLRSEEFRDILCRESISRKEKQKLVRVFLEGRRYPEKVRIQTELEQCQAELIQEFGIRVEYPLEFEGDRLSLRIEARDASGFTETAEKLKNLAESDSLKRMFLLLCGERV